MVTESNAHAKEGSILMTDYRPEPLTDFSIEQNRAAYERALRSVERQMGREYELIIGGENVRTEAKIVSINPARPDEVVGVVSKANEPLAEKAINAAAKAFETWKRVPSDQRARYLFKAAAILRRRKFEFAAWLTIEAGKTRAEADADAAEAIDFLEYYGRQMMQLSERQPLTRAPGEDNEWQYIPLGVGIVISPWNFPLAIMAGMTAAAFVAGNAVVLKPASATPVIAAKFMEVLAEAGTPPGVVNYLPGNGSEIGDYLVDHPLTRFISFTGSRDVGLRIHERSAKIHPGQRWMKRFVAEMGGKDAIIVDENADLDWAAQGIVQSAFGFSGQKCSACSRAIVHEKVYDDALERVIRLTRALKIGDPKDADTFVGPLIDEQAFNKVLSYIERGKKESALALGGQPVASPGYFVQPTIFVDAPPESNIMRDEIFGPALAFAKARDFDDALRIANDTEYGLTGSVYSNNRTNLEKARDEFHVGNLYFNRKCTGAVVGVHPFGGFNLSGTNSKAGGPDYLRLFTQAKVVSEWL